MLNGVINLQVGGTSGYLGNGQMPSFFGPFDPRKKIPANPSGPVGGAYVGGIETTKGVSVLYKSVDKNVNDFNIASQGQIGGRAQSPAAFSGQAGLSMELYIISASYAYEIQGSEAFSKFYQRYYPISSVIRKATIQGIARNEYEYEDLAYWIRTAQYELAKGSLDFMGLYIPATGINAYGFIPKFSISLGDTTGANPNPIPAGIPYEFDFVITEDTTDQASAKFATIMQGNASFAQFHTYDQYWISGNSNPSSNGTTWKTLQGEYTKGLNYADLNAGIVNTNASVPANLTKNLTDFVT
jgi:hypothetical protein